MNVLVVFVVGLAVVAFGPWFLIQAIAGYVIGAWCGSFAEVRMRDLHCEICRRTGDKASDIDDLAAYVMKASKVGGILCPVIPAVAFMIGVYCSCKADRLRDLRTCPEEESEAAVTREEAIPCFDIYSAGTGVRL